MKILSIFILLCVLLLILLVWQFSGMNAETAPPASAPSNLVEPAAVPEAPRPSIVTPAPEPATTALPSKTENSPVNANQQAAVATAQTSTNSDAAAPAVPASAPAVKWLDDSAEERDARRRMNELRDVLLDDPANEAALASALRLAREREWPVETCDLLARLVLLHPYDADLRFELGTQYMLLRRWVEAIPHLRAAADARPDHVKTLYNLAVAHQALGHLADARREWTRVIELDPHNPDPYVHRGEVLLDLRDWLAAAANFEQALEIEPRALDVTLNLALVRTKLGRAESARALLLPLLAEHPRHVPLLNRLAETTWNVYLSDPAGREDLLRETRDYCDRSLSIVPDQTEIKELREQAGGE